MSVIRNAIASDASRLAEILIFAKRCAYRPIFQNDLVSFQEMQVLDLALLYRDNPEARKDVYVYDDGIVKGMMHIGEWLPPSGIPALELKELYVDPLLQGQGVGRGLMLHFLSLARQSAAPSVCLWVLEKNLAARRFYEKMGFHPNGSRKLEPGTSEYLLQYEK